MNFFFLKIPILNYFFLLKKASKHALAHVNKYSNYLYNYFCTIMHEDKDCGIIKPN